MIYKYWNCVYKDLGTGECCNGTEEGVPCCDQTNEKCKAFEPNEYPQSFNYIKIIRNNAKS